MADLPELLLVRSSSPLWHTSGGSAAAAPRQPSAQPPAAPPSPSAAIRARGFARGAGRRDLRERAPSPKTNAATWGACLLLWARRTKHFSRAHLAFPLRMKSVGARPVGSSPAASRPQSRAPRRPQSRTPRRPQSRATAGALAARAHVCMITPRGHSLAHALYGIYSIRGHCSSSSRSRVTSSLEGLRPLGASLNIFNS